MSVRCRGGSGRRARLGNYEKNEWSWCLWGATGWGPAPGWTGHTGVAGLGTRPLHVSNERGWLPLRESEAVSVPACPSCVASLSPRMPWLGSSSSIWVTIELGLSWSLVFDSGLSSRRPSLLPFSSVQSLSRVRLCDPMDCSVPGFPVHHQLLEFAHTHVHWVSDAIQPSQPLSSPSPAFSFSQHQGLFKWVSSSHQVAKVLYWSFSLSISPSNEYLGLISFSIDWLALLAVQGTLKSLLQHHTSKASILWHWAFFIVQLTQPYILPFSPAQILLLRDGIVGPSGPVASRLGMPRTLLLFGIHYILTTASLVAQMVKNLPAMWETRLWFLGWEDPLEKGMATRSSFLAWRISWADEPGGLQSMVSHRVRYDSSDQYSLLTFICDYMWLVNLPCRGIYFGKLKGRGYILYDFCAYVLFLVSSTGSDTRLKWSRPGHPKMRHFAEWTVFSRRQSRPSRVKKTDYFSLNYLKKIRQGQKGSYF